MSPESEITTMSTPASPMEQNIFITKSPQSLYFSVCDFTSKLMTYTKNYTKKGAKALKKTPTFGRDASIRDCAARRPQCQLLTFLLLIHSVHKLL